MKPAAELDLEGLEVFDGAMATNLEARGFDLSGPLWSAHVLESSPGAIAAIHREYLEAGADCLTTASYQVSFEGYEKSGRSEADAADALREAVRIAVRARDEYQKACRRRVWIAASLGCYGAMLHNGAEYHGRYDCSFSDLVSFHSRRIRVLASTEADFILFETIPLLEEARAIVAALKLNPGAPAGVSFSCRDHLHLAHGEKLSDGAAMLGGEPQVVAVGVNCVAPDLVADLVREIRRSTTERILVYPNSGEGWDSARRCWVGESRAGEFGRLARMWRAAGADWIGGCCRTGPEHIRSIGAALHRRT